MGHALKVALERLQKIAEGFVAALPSIALAGVTFALFYLVGKVVRTTVRRATERRGNARGAGMAMGRIA